jgi:gamma-glutamylcyclotransferase (GGCT)/AIG2-like uncharacterized protein YtfP
MKYSLDGMSPVDKIGNRTGKVVVAVYKSRQNAIARMNELHSSHDYTDDAEYYVEHFAIVDAVV